MRHRGARVIERPEDDVHVTRHHHVCDQVVVHACTVQNRPMHDVRQVVSCQPSGQRLRIKGVFPRCMTSAHPWLVRAGGGRAMHVMRPIGGQSACRTAAGESRGDEIGATCDIEMGQAATAKESIHRVSVQKYITLCESRVCAMWW